MKTLIACIILSLVLASTAVADKPAMGFWVIDVAKLQTALQDHGTIDKIDDTDMSMLAECSGSFTGANTQFRLQSDSISFDILAKDDGNQLSYSAVLGWRNVKRSALHFKGTLVVKNTWSFPDEWETSRRVILFKRLNLKK